MWSWLEVAGNVLHDLWWPLVVYFGGLLVCYVISVSAEYWIGKWRRDRREARFRRMGLDEIDQMDPRAFRQYLAFLFESAGFTVRPTPPTRNLGVDLVIIHPTSEERIAVQAHHTAGVVEERSVREVAVARKFYQCTRGIIVTTGGFTPEARERAEGEDVLLVDRKKLQQIIALTLGSVLAPAPEPVPESVPEAQSAVSNG